MARVMLTLSGALTFPGPRLEVECEGGTVGDAIDDLLNAHPAVRGRLFRPDGSLAVSVLVNGLRVRQAGGLDTVLTDGDSLTLLLPLSGG